MKPWFIYLFIFETLVYNTHWFSKITSDIKYLSGVGLFT